MTRVSSPAHNPFSTASAADGAEPYVSPPSQRGQQYSVPEGYRHHFERSWLAPSRSVLLGLLCVAGLMAYLRGDHLLPVLMGTTTTRVVAVDRAASAVAAVPQQASVFPLDFPAMLPPTAAGPTTGSGSGIVKCVQADGMVVYQQQRDCGPAAAAARALQGAR
jgi:hypothetical protein